MHSSIKIPEAWLKTTKSKNFGWWYVVVWRVWPANPNSGSMAQNDEVQTFVGGGGLGRGEAGSTDAVQPKDTHVQAYNNISASGRQAQNTFLPSVSVTDRFRRLNLSTWFRSVLQVISQNSGQLYFAVHRQSTLSFFLGNRQFPTKRTSWASSTKVTRVKLLTFGRTLPSTRPKKQISYFSVSCRKELTFDRQRETRSTNGTTKSWRMRHASLVVMTTRTQILSFNSVNPLQLILQLTHVQDVTDDDVFDQHNTAGVIQNLGLKLKKASTCCWLFINDSR